MTKGMGTNMKRAERRRPFQGPRRLRSYAISTALTLSGADNEAKVSAASEIPLKRPSSFSPSFQSDKLFFSGKFIAAILIVTGVMLGAGLAEAAMTLPWEKKGEALYEKEKYEDALKSFLDEQVKNPKDRSLQYNIGSTQYRLQKYDEAAKAYSEAATSPDTDLAEKALYNLGNTSYQQGKLEEAVAAYEKALQLNPQDEDAKYNLEFVREEMKRRINDSLEREKNQQKNPQKPEQKQDQQEQQGGDKKDKQDQQDQQQGEQGKKGEEQGQPQSTPQENEGKGSMNKKEAEALLQNIGEDRKNLQKENAKRMQGKSAMPDKDW